MKKVICFVVCCIAVVAVTSCGPNLSTKEISVTGADGTVYNSYMAACSHGDFDAARDYVGRLKEQLAVVKAEGDWKEISAFEELIKEAEDYIANEEIQYLAAMKEEQADNRIILMLSQRPVEGLEAAEKSCLGKKVDERYLDILDYSAPDEIKQFRKYIVWCGDYNSNCNNVLNIAIACGNQSLAMKTIHCYRLDPELELKLCKKEEGEVDHYDVYAHYTNSSKENAQKKYDEAVKSGVFN